MRKPARTKIVITASSRMFVTPEVQSKIVSALAFLPEDFDRMRTRPQRRARLLLYRELDRETPRQGRCPDPVGTTHLTLCEAGQWGGMGS